MTNIILNAQASRFTRKVPEVKPGYTVRVHERIQESGKERVQVFEGLVIAVHNGHVPTDASFTVRKVVSGIGVEKNFPVHSPVVDKIEVKKVAKVRRAKLFFLRGRTGKAARMIERFTTEGEFDVKADEPMVPESGTVEEVTEENMVKEAPVAETPAPEASVAEVKADEPATEEKKEEPAA